jgi:hypothetical protein
MAIGPSNQVILGCALHGSVILDDRDFSIVAQLPDDYGVDVAAFNPGNNHYFLAESGHSPPKLGVIRAPLGAPAMSAGVPTNSGGGTPHSVVAEQLFNQAYVPIASNANGNICSSGGGVDANGCIAVYSTGPSPTTIVSAILPNARTTTVGNPVTAFATVMNTGGKVATQCAIGSPDGLQADLLFQQTNPATNQPVGTLNSPALSIAPGASQSFVFRIDPTASFVSEIPLVFNCADAAPAVHVAGLNNFLLNASSVPIPDMLSISDTLTHDGNIVISGATGSGVMGVATIDIGPVGGTIIATATDTPFGQLPRNLPIDLALCQTNSSGVCQGPLAQSLTISGVTPNQVLTFTVVATAKGITIPYIPQFNRAFVSLTSNGSPVGETGAAIKMQ